MPASLTSDTSPPLSNHDVELLHQIVIRAQKHAAVQDRPSTALLEAYEAIFAEHHLDTIDDRACFRFVLQLGSPGIRGDTLYEKFETLLHEQAGIVLDFDEEYASLGQHGVVHRDADDENEPKASPHKVERRNSFTSMYDATKQTNRERPQWGSLSRAPEYTPSRDVTEEIDDSPKRPQRAQLVSERTESAGQPPQRNLAVLWNIAVEQDRQSLMRQALDHWNEQAGQWRMTANYYDRRLLQKAFMHWANTAHTRFTESKLAPLEMRLQRMHDWRISRTAFVRWLLLARTSARAKMVDVARIKQNVFTSWNDELRCRHVQGMIDGRLLAKSIYAWVLASHKNLVERRHEDRLKMQILQRLLVKSRARRDELQLLHDQYVEADNKHVSSFALQCWQAQMKLHRAHSKTAAMFGKPKLEQDHFSAWQTRLKDIQKNVLRADDARYYFLMSKYLKQWREKAAQARERRRVEHKRRREESRKIITNVIKSNLARRVLRTWHAQMEHVRVMERSLEERDARRSRAMVVEIIQSWHTKSTQLQQSNNQASTQYEHSLKDRSLRSHIDAARQVHNLHERANQFHRIRLSEVCYTQLRRISMKAFELKRRQQDADAMNARHFATHFRILVRHWAEKSQLAEYRLSNAPTEHEPASPPEEGWDESRLDELPPNTLGPLRTPAYLGSGTPSRRARAMLLASTTPATHREDYVPFSARLKAGMTGASNLHE